MACLPHASDPHLFPSVPPFLWAWDSYREVYRKVSYGIIRAAPPLHLLCVSGSPPLIGGEGEKSHGMRSPYPGTELGRADTSLVQVYSSAWSSRASTGD